jgi:hypothetical protein
LIFVQWDAGENSSSSAESFEGGDGGGGAKICMSSTPASPQKRPREPLSNALKVTIVISTAFVLGLSILGRAFVLGLGSLGFYHLEATKVFGKDLKAAVEILATALSPLRFGFRP